MKELKCPKCGTVITVDEADYASIVNQVKNAEFNKEVAHRIEEFHKQQEALQQVRDVQTAQAHQKDLTEKDKVIGEKEREITRLNEQISAIAEKRDLELSAAVTDKEKEIETLKSTIQQDAQKLEIAVLKERQQAKEAAQAKDNEIAELRNQASLAATEAAKKLEIAVMQEQQKVQEAMQAKDNEIAELRNQASLAATEAALREKNLQHDFDSKLQAVKTEAETRLRLANEEVERLKDFKARLSTKMVGESLETHCSTIFNGEMRPLFPNAYFEKDNDASGGSKGDFIFRDKEDGIEYISIMFEMKNEMDETANKHKNEDFFKKLDADRNAKGCEYAVLVSLLEPESELYNTGIVDVSYRYPKMYVIRPQFFKAMITLLVNAAKKSLEYQKQLIMVQSREVDVTNFENKLKEFRNKFGDHYTRAAGKFEDAIKKIDETIKKLQDIKKSFEQSENYLRLANQDAEDLTIRKLTYKNPTMKDMFDKAQTHNNSKPEDEG